MRSASAEAPWAAYTSNATSNCFVAWSRSAALAIASPESSAAPAWRGAPTRPESALTRRVHRGRLRAVRNGGKQRALPTIALEQFHRGQDALTNRLRCARREPPTRRNRDPWARWASSTDLRPLPAIARLLRRCHAATPRAPGSSSTLGGLLVRHRVPVARRFQPVEGPVDRRYVQRWRPSAVIRSVHPRALGEIARPRAGTRRCSYGRSPVGPPRSRTEPGCCRDRFDRIGFRVGWSSVPMGIVVVLSRWW